MSHPLDAPLLPLLRDFDELRSAGDAFVLVSLVATAGSTYRKCGAQMLITRDFQARGLLSGGCLEVDLIEHARGVLATGTAQSVRYDMRGEDDRLFGIGSGCEGAMTVLLQRVGPSERWQPLAAIADAVQSARPSALGLIVSGPSAGRGWWQGGGDAPVLEPESIAAAREAVAASGEPELLEVDGVASVLILPLQSPPLLLLCGAGADAEPLARHAIAVGFAVTVCDHRPALAVAARFPHCALRCQPAAAFDELPELAHCDAAIIMSHHLESDLEYLRALAARDRIGYVGLLGPPARRERLLAGLGPLAAALDARLRAPLGLDIGARTPDAIALAAVAELHAWIAGRAGGPWREAPRTTPR